MRDTGGLPATFAELAVSASLAIQKLKLDLIHTMIVARRVGVSEMGITVVEAERQVEIDHLEQIFDLLKKMSEVEPQVRAVLERKARRRWSDFARVAAI